MERAMSMGHYVGRVKCDELGLDCKAVVGEHFLYSTYGPIGTARKIELFKPLPLEITANAFDALFTVWVEDGPDGDKKAWYKGKYYIGDETTLIQV